MSSPNTRTTRRTSAEVRHDILAAATEVFAEHGFGGATTREIARVAQVAEPLIFRSFGTKQGLYEAAVTEPLNQFAQDFSDRWLDRPDATAEQVLTQFVTDLYDSVHEQRLIFRALTSQKLAEFGMETGFGPIGAVSEAIKNSEQLSWDTEVATRAAVLMVVAMATLDEASYSPSSTSPRERVINELSAMLIGAAGLSRPR